MSRHDIVEVDVADREAVLGWTEAHNAFGGPGLALAPGLVWHTFQVMPASICWLALVGGSAVATGAAYHDDSVPSVQGVTANVIVDPAHRRGGIGGQLMDLALAWARGRDLDLVDVRMVDGDEDAWGFLARRGFVEMEREQSLILNLAEADIAPIAPPDGVRVVLLADHPELEEGVYAVACEAWPDIPSPEPMEPGSLARWRELEMDQPSVTPERVTVAVAGEQVVGYGVLADAARPGALCHDMTGVLRAWRGRGVAGAIKRAQIAWAAEHGVRALVTENDVGNVPMLRINRALGYRELPITVWLRRLLTPRG